MDDDIFDQTHGESVMRPPKDLYIIRDRGSQTDTLTFGTMGALEDHVKNMGPQWELGGETFSARPGQTIVHVIELRERRDGLRVPGLAELSESTNSCAD